MLYEIINPSDAYTLRADDLKIAAVACVLLGNGQYGLRPCEAGGEEVPLMLFSRNASDEWFTKRFGKGVTETIASVLLDPATARVLADCMDSVLIGKPDLRAEAELVAESGEGAKLERHDEFRSSLNDIGRRAWEMARLLREGKGTKSVIRAPVQVFRG